MADNTTESPAKAGPETEAKPAGRTPLEGGAYEIIRARLETHGADLRQRLTALNTERQSVFGAVEPALIATDRISTQNSCVPRDIVALGGNRFLFGYNVHIGLKSTTDLKDVFGVYEYDAEEHAFRETDLGLLRSGDFESDFAYLYKYYKETTFVKFMVIGPHLYMAFRVGRAVEDVKTFKWLLGGGEPQYLGNRSDHEYVFPPQQEFEWIRAHRGMHRAGVHPHVSIEDRLFVETVGGDLTIKIEDNTSSGEGIYAEAVTNSDQTLDDAEIFYATVGSLILLKILPYQEKHYRYLVYNEKVKKVTRIDSIATSCVLLPDEHGLIFSDGYYLQTGELKRFESGLRDMLFERRIASPNGEDYLYAFYNRRDGVYILMSYNVIDQSVETPIICNGYTTFPDGELVYFKSEDQPQKHHTLQVWQTPYMQGEFRASEQTDSYLYKVGNPDIVRCMAECHEVLNLLGKEDTYADLYVDLARKSGDIVDSYFWVGDERAGNLKPALLEIRSAAQAAIAEFDKVQRLRRSTAEETTRTSDKARKLVAKARNTRPDDILGFVDSLAQLRTVRGEVISLKDLRYADTASIEQLEKEIAGATETVSENCVTFLLKPEALDPYQKKVEQLGSEIEPLGKVAGADALEERVAKAGSELEMLIEIVGNLKIADATQTTQIIDGISAIYSELNKVRVALKNRKKDLARQEGAAEFGAQMKLLNQAVVNYLEICDTPEKCEEYLSKLMIQLEELEGRFSDFDEYLEQISGKRDELYNAFEARKLTLIEARGRRATSLVKSGERILNTIRHRLDGFETIPEINGYMAGDLMLEKVRNLIGQLKNLGDSVKADDLQTRLKTIHEDSVRQLKDRKELFVDGRNVIQFGKHKFSVNHQELQLSIVPHDGEMCFHLAGTNFFEAVHDEAFLATRDVWDQETVSENSDVYRGEYLAWQILKELTTGAGGENGLEGVTAAQWLELAEPERLALVQRFMAPRYQEGYTKGVHGHDATRLLDRLVSVHQAVGLLRFAPADRALALLFWAHWPEQDEEKGRFDQKVKAYGLMSEAFGPGGHQDTYVEFLRDRLSTFHRAHGEVCAHLSGSDPGEAAEYLFLELQDHSPFAVSPEASALVAHLRHVLTSKRLEKQFAEAQSGLEGHPVSAYEIARDWLSGVLCEPFSGQENASASGTARQYRRYIVEAAAHLAKGGFELLDVRHVETTATLEGLLGSHARIDKEAYQFDYLDFTQRLRRFERDVVPRFRTCHERKTRLVSDQRNSLRLDEFKPRVMSSFVRNRLLDRVYLPLIGDNLAKQMGTAGDDTRTDRMGLLLLISPPGYGKTTLMEYVANRLGVTFMKINGPAIGHDVKSLDPEDAPNASAREEIHKLNLALEMGDNVMIYLDDIQHCHPEFLQKFISLCDAQRKIEGVFRGRPRTYDLRGKKVCVVMAGNPYTESGGKFQIPDMLANRADTYNLGDILGGHQADFEASYLENCLTSSPALSRLASRSQADVYAIMKIAAGSSQEGIDFEGNYSVEEIEEMTAVMKKLMRVRDTILRVNLEYIRSAAMEDAYRTEPPFKLQGSYRNMNRIAEKILPIMTDQEVEAVILDHYENEAQTLTTGAEANLLKFRELENLLTEEETARWEEIRRRFGRNLLMGSGGKDNDPVSRVVGTLATFADGLSRIEGVMSRAVEHQTQPATLADVTVERLEQLIAGLRAVPVEVEIKVVPVQEAPDSDQKSTSAKKKASTKKASSSPELPVDIQSRTEQKE